MKFVKCRNITGSEIEKSPVLVGFKDRQNNLASGWSLLFFLSVLQKNGSSVGFRRRLLLPTEADNTLPVCGEVVFNLIWYNAFIDQKTWMSREVALKLQAAAALFF